MTCDRSVVFSGNSVSNKTDRHDIIKILLKVALNTINPYLEFYFYLILGQKKCVFPIAMIYLLCIGLIINRHIVCTGYTLYIKTCYTFSKYCNDPNVVNCPNILNDHNIVNSPNIVNSSNVENCPNVVNDHTIVNLVQML